MLNLKRIFELVIMSFALMMISSSVMAAKSSLIMGMVLEPPHLDPTAGAAAAIDEVVYANIFEGLETKVPELNKTVDATRVVNKLLAADCVARAIARGVYEAEALGGFESYRSRFEQYFS